jgi:L-2,4-diaminobutyrate decarboxylase
MRRGTRIAVACITIRCGGVKTASTQDRPCKSIDDQLDGSPPNPDTHADRMSEESALEPDFQPDLEGLTRALTLMCEGPTAARPQALPEALPETGVTSAQAIEWLAPHVFKSAAYLDSPLAAAHMDPPTPWITWATAQWNARLNQNLLHPATAPAARRLEQRVVGWLAPHFGMTGGHMTPGSTLANLTALWAARDCAGVTEVVASDMAHLSILKAARILGLKLRQVPTDRKGAMVSDALPSDLSRSALVLTAGTTSTGAVDPMALSGRAAWTHVDAAWAGPLRLTRMSDRLDGLEKADSVAVSAHKWLFQPKESALIFFKDVDKANEAISFGGAYLAAPNIGVLGSHGAMAIPLLATLMAWGREGLAARIGNCIFVAETIASQVDRDDRLELLAWPVTGVVNWRPRDTRSFDAWHRSLPEGMVSTTTVHDERWFRNAIANPGVNASAIIEAIEAVRV